MAIASVAIKKDGVFAVTGGTDQAYTSIGRGKFSNFLAPLTSPEMITLESTLAFDAGKESTHLIKFEYFLPPPAGSPFGSPDLKMQVHTVIKADTSYWTEVQLIDACKRMAHLLSQNGVISQILRGDG